jgi:hypothetical protein
MSVYDEIKEERERQDEKWGGPEHDDEHSVLDWVVLVRQRVSMTRKSWRERFIEGAALCVAAVESLDRKDSGEEE